MGGCRDAQGTAARVWFRGAVFVACCAWVQHFETHAVPLPALARHAAAVARRGPHDRVLAPQRTADPIDCQGIEQVQRAAGMVGVAVGRIGNLNAAIDCLRLYRRPPQAVNRTRRLVKIPLSRGCFVSCVEPNRFTPTASRERRPRGIVSPVAEPLLSRGSGRLEERQRPRR